ncbi:MAG: SOS response-associated peptidase family protein [Cellvibrionaceae bacterium]|nr:SOS response-associated peptidase family protein [Cellvibrionaceae bacterium]
MCGYVGRKFNLAQQDIPYWREYADLLRQPGGQYYQRHRVNHLVIWRNGKAVYTDALWWYALKRENDQLVLNPKVTSFNARNLDSPLWRSAIRARRGVLFASEIGESQGKARYLMQSQTLFALGCVYQQWQQAGATVYSFALITRDPHPRFSRYHDKSMPLFLPNNPEFLDHWLDPTVEQSPQISAVLEQPKLRVTFDVLPVKTYKRAEPLGQIELLQADDLPSEN